MKKKNISTFEVEINSIDLIKQFWKEKVLILSVSVICTLLAFLFVTFVNTQKKDSQTRIILQVPSVVALEKYKDFLNDDNFINNNNNYNNNKNNNNNNNNSGNNNGINNNNFSLIFFNSLKAKLSSTDNLESFLDQIKEFDNFKVFLKERNITAKQYFTKDSFGIITDKKQQVSNEFFLNFNKELDGVTFLNNYVEFTKNKVINEVRNALKIKLLVAIEKHDIAFEIANQIKLEVPILKSMSSGSSVVNEPTSLFYLGTQVLSQQSKYYKKLLLDLESEKLNIDVILDKASPARTVDNNSFRVWMGLVFGFFFSLLVIFSKFLLKKNN
jgi:LPS O-antigen subunit length determinant protein (WzzB/FepE family)